MFTGLLWIVAKQYPDIGIYNITFRRSKNETKSYWKQISQSSPFHITNHRFFNVPTGGMLKAELSLTTTTYEGKLMTAACMTLTRTNQTTCQRISGKLGRVKNFVGQLILHEVFKVQKNDQLKVTISRWKKYIYKVGVFNRLRLYYL